MNNDKCDGSVDDPVSHARDVMAAHIAALNAGDEAALAATLHFPHYRLSGGTLKTWEGPDDPAGGAPGGKEINHHGISTVIAQPKTAAAVKSREAEIGRQTPARLGAAAFPLAAALNRQRQA